MKRKRFSCWVLAVLVGGTLYAAEMPPDPKVVFEISPKQATYTVGQRVTVKLTIDYGDAEPYSQLDIDGMPDSDTAEIGEYRQLATGSPQKLSFAADMVLLKQKEGIYAPALRGQRAVSTRSGGFARKRIFPFRSVASPVELTVDAPPSEGRPDDWSGAVGDYRLDATLAPQTCRVGDLLTLKWSLVGRGTVSDAAKFAYQPGRNFRVYPPLVTLQADGVVSCSQVVIPLGTNITEAAAFHVSVFNPVKGMYETLSAGPFKLDVRVRETVEAMTNVLSGLVIRNGADMSETVAKEHEGVAGWMRVFRRRWGAYATLDVESSARLAPAASARVLFDIPAGVSVEIRERHGAWARVLVGSAAGWVPEAVLKSSKLID